MGCCRICQNALERIFQYFEFIHSSQWWVTELNQLSHSSISWKSMLVVVYQHIVSWLTTDVSMKVSGFKHEVLKKWLFFSFFRLTAPLIGRQQILLHWSSVDSLWYQYSSKCDFWHFFDWNFSLSQLTHQLSLHLTWACRWLETCYYRHE